VNVASTVAQGGLYSVVVSGMDPGGNLQGAEFDVIIGDATLALETTPATASVVPGGAATQGTILMQPGGGFGGAVNLTLSSITGVDANGNQITGTMPAVTFSPNDGRRIGVYSEGRSIYRR
jgi:hypothetical protein